MSQTALARGGRSRRSGLEAGTPPNAIVADSGHVSSQQLLQAGIRVTLGSIVLVTLVCWWAVPLVWGR